MNLDFTEEQQMLRTAARTFLATECPKKKVRELEETENGFDRDLWKKVADLGWTGLVIPETYGGSGADFTTESEGGETDAQPLFHSQTARCA